MRKRVKGKKISRKRGARVALVKNLARSVILTEKIKTTKVKARLAQIHIEKLVTLAKKNNLASRRKIFAKLGDKQAVKKLVTEITPRFTKVNSGFTRIVNLGQRIGDAAPMALLEFSYPEGISKVIKESRRVAEKKTETTKETKTSRSKVSS